MRRNMHVLSAGLTLALAVGSLAACAGPAKEAASSPQPVSNPAASAPAGQAKPSEPVLAGKVLETMDAAGYTYILLEKDGRSSWSAVPETKVTVGDNIILIPGIDMANFESHSLKRTFATIHFSGGVEGAVANKGVKSAAKIEGSVLPPNHPKIPKQDAGAAAAPESKRQAASPISGKVVEAMNAGGYTYVCLEKDSMKTWVAIPADEVKVGSEMSMQPGNEMTNFASPSLKRTFDKIIFSPGPAAK